MEMVTVSDNPLLSRFGPILNTHVVTDANDRQYGYDSQE